jgi:hypothetical protein
LRLAWDGADETRVRAGDTCFCLYRQSWFVGEFQEFIPSSTSAKLDRYIVDVLSILKGRQVRLPQKVAREGVRFLDDEVISEMKNVRLGIASTGLMSH